MRALVASCAVTNMSLEGMGAAFIIVAHMKNKGRAVLRALHKETVREYRDPRRALEQLKAMGVVKAAISFERWTPNEGTP